MSEYTPKAAKYKQDLVAQLAKRLVDSPIVGTVNMENLPASVLSDMRATLRGKADLFMTKRRLMSLALKEAAKSRKGIEGLHEKMKGMPALLFTDENPFKLYKIIKKSKSSAPAKGGQEAPKDVVVKAGATPFMPGPIIGELGAFGIKTGVENGKVAIKEDKVVAKAGDVISSKLAGILTRLDIKPMEVGLDITAIYEDGTIYGRSVLDIDEEQFMANLEQAAVWARNLAMDAAYPAKELLPDMLTIAHRQARNLAMEANVLTKDTMPQLLAKAQMQIGALKNAANL